MSEAFVPSKETLAADACLILGDVLDFSRYGSGVTLRAYQKEVAQAVVDSVLQRRGLAQVVMFPRQSGKNELQAQIEAYLLCLFSDSEAEIVKVSPTWKPQSQNAMRRLERMLKRNPLTCTLWEKEAGYIYRVGSARVYFLSAAPETNIVGATASTLLEVDEAQDVQRGKFDKEMAPMAASTNATRVFWGTAWTGQTLLGRELRAAKRAEKRDGTRRVFRLSGEEVAEEVPEYGKFVAEQVARLGRSHPMVRTQYFSEEITAESGMFPPWRVALMKDGSAAGGCRARSRAASTPSCWMWPGRTRARRAIPCRWRTSWRTRPGCHRADHRGGGLSTLADELICRPTYRPRAAAAVGGGAAHPPVRRAEGPGRAVAAALGGGGCHRGGRGAGILFGEGAARAGDPLHLQRCQQIALGWDFWASWTAGAGRRAGSPLKASSSSASFPSASTRSSPGRKSA